jgi:hypothetical protein
MSKLYKPVIVKKEIDDEHFYYVDGKFTPGVTTILSETMPTPYALRHWIGEVGNDKAQERLEKAGERGSQIHDACERLLNGLTVNLLDEFPNANDKKVLTAFVNWVAEVQPQVINTEFTVASEEGYAGTLDLHCNIGDEPWIIDLKTSSGIYDSHKLQIVAYRQAFYEMTGTKANVGILHLNHRTIKGYSLHTEMKIGGREVDQDDFLKVFEVYKMLNGGTIPEPKLKDVYPEELKLEGGDAK